MVTPSLTPVMRNNVLDWSINRSFSSRPQFQLRASRPRTAFLTTTSTKSTTPKQGPLSIQDMTLWSWIPFSPWKNLVIEDKDKYSLSKSGLTQKNFHGLKPAS